MDLIVKPDMTKDKPSVLQRSKSATDSNTTIFFPQSAFVMFEV